mgnify:CR=1 FL=1
MLVILYVTCKTSSFKFVSMVLVVFVNMLRIIDRMLWRWNFLENIFQKNESILSFFSDQKSQNWLMILQRYLISEIWFSLVK